MSKSGIVNLWHAKSFDICHLEFSIFGLLNLEYSIFGKPNLECPKNIFGRPNLEILNLEFFIFDNLAAKS